MHPMIRAACLLVESRSWTEIAPKLSSILRPIFLKTAPCVQLRGAECVIMAGDPKQLPPTVISEAARECSLDMTLFERLVPPPPSGE